MSTSDVITMIVLGTFVSVAYFAILADILAERRHTRRMEEHDG